MTVIKLPCDPGKLFWYEGHAVSLWRKSARDAAADEPHSDSQGLHCGTEAGIAGSGRGPLLDHAEHLKAESGQ